MKINLMCFISIFIFDWLYAWVFKYFGKKRFIYPTLLTIVGLSISKFISIRNPDGAEFAIFFLLPGYLTIHCLGWLHINTVFRRIQKNLTER